MIRNPQAWIFFFKFDYFFKLAFKHQVNQSDAIYLFVLFTGLKFTQERQERNFEKAIFSASLSGTLLRNNIVGLRKLIYYSILFTTEI